jgi:NAD(P)-dependent dehydrogenase (short-subunit alcohol dehydrogenase family)
MPGGFVFMKKTILITGASSGIGHAAARLFVTKDWNVVATMRSPENEKVLVGLNEVLVARLDVRDAESIREAIASGISRFGKIDALINNAGFSLSGVFEANSREKVREQFDVNVLGMMDVTREILPHFRGNKSGLIINISSRAGLVAPPMLSLYCASKYALEGFSESLAYELSSQNVVVKIVEPSGGVTGTNFVERLGKERSQQVSLADYHDFTARADAVYASIQSSRKTSADEVAQVIYGAAIDGTSRLRYFTGEDVGGFLQARREMAEEDYLCFMRSRFGLAR